MLTQKMADLPKQRIIPDCSSFTNVAIDYFGPTFVRNGKGTIQCCDVVFTHPTIKAVHLAVANCLDTDACINVSSAEVKLLIFNLTMQQTS